MDLESRNVLAGIGPAPFVVCFNAHWVTLISQIRASRVVEGLAVHLEWFRLAFRCQARLERCNLVGDPGRGSGK